MARRVEETWPFSDESCPMRGAALSHITDGTPKCTHCGRYVRERPAPILIETTSGSADFTERQIRTFEFLHYLFLKGRV